MPEPKTYGELENDRERREESEAGSSDEYRPTSALDDVDSEEWKEDVDSSEDRSISEDEEMGTALGMGETDWNVYRKVSSVLVTTWISA